MRSWSGWNDGTLSSPVSTRAIVESRLRMTLELPISPMIVGLMLRATSSSSGPRSSCASSSAKISALSSALSRARAAPSVLLSCVRAAPSVSSNASTGVTSMGVHATAALLFTTQPDDSV